MEAWLEGRADAAGSGGARWRSQECSALMQSLVVVLQTVCSLSRKNQAWKEVAGPPQLLDCITLHSRAWTCLYICGQNVCKLDVCFFSLPCGLWLAGQGITRVVTATAVMMLVARVRHSVMGLLARDGQGLESDLLQPRQADAVDQFARSKQL